MSVPAIIGIVVGSLLLAGTVVWLILRPGNVEAVSNRMCGGCRRAMMPDWTRCFFCGWEPVARLEFITGPLMGQMMPLTEEVTTVGSVAGNSIVLSDPAVSRKHMGIRRVNGIYECADFGSSNGVYINGHRTAKKTLVVGDIVRVGNTEMVFRRD